MDSQEKRKVRRPVRIALYVGVPAAALAFVLGALFVWGQAREGRALSGLKMNHKFHADQGLSCDTCHEQNPSNPRFMSFPDHDTCSACHEDALNASSPQKDCALCHTQPDYKTQVRKNQVLSPLVTFDHAQHEKAKVDCTQCHATVDKDVLTGNEMIPVMDRCVKCHTERNVPGANDCSSCHPKGWEKLKPPTHTAAWKTTHGTDLTKEKIDSDCLACHTKQLGNSCTTCHHKALQTIGRSESCSRCHGEGFEKTRPKDHTPLWTLTHGKGLTQSRADGTCALCHNTANGNDCQSCHRREAPKNHTTGWSMNLHGMAARSDRQSCTVCHDQAECISCHTTNPPFTHTASWGEPFDRHCLSCHIEGGGYVSGGIGSNCSMCHNSVDIFAAHTSLHGHTSGTTCLSCHGLTAGIGPAISHPFPGSGATCVTCHPFP